MCMINMSMSNTIVMGVLGAFKTKQKKLPLVGKVRSMVGFGVDPHFT